MKTVQVYEFKDLSEKIQEKVKNKWIEEEIESQLDWLSNELEEKDFWEEVGCSKHYGESTPWFVPSVYYEHHKESIDETVNGMLEEAVFDMYGTPLAL